MHGQSPKIGETSTKTLKPGQAAPGEVQPPPTEVQPPPALANLPSLAGPDLRWDPAEIRQPGEGWPSTTSVARIDPPCKIGQTLPCWNGLANPRHIGTDWPILARLAYPDHAFCR